jgi:hypothetical protein
MNYKQSESLELSNEDIYKVVGSVNIIPYPDFQKYQSLHQCFGNKDKIVIFFETTSSTVGHWQCMMKSTHQSSNGVKIMFHFWDSYGLAPSKDKSYIEKATLIRLKEFKPYLPQLIDDVLLHNIDVDYNTIDYQSWTKNVNTCGRHICTRMLHNDKSEDEYYDYLTQYMKDKNLSNFDEAVTNIIFNILGK